MITIGNYRIEHLPPAEQANARRMAEQFGKALHVGSKIELIIAHDADKPVHGSAEINLSGPPERVKQIAEMVAAMCEVSQ